MNNLYSIVLTKYDDFFEIFVRYFIKNINRDLVVIDDGLSDKIKGKYPQFIYLESPKPFAWCLSNNLGMMYRSDDDVLLLQDDWTIQTKDIDLIMQHIAYKEEDIGTVVSRMDNVMNHDMQRKFDGMEYVVTYHDVPPMLLKRSVIEKVGLFDENFRFGVGGYEDNDYSICLRNAGYKAVIAQQCFIGHGGEEFGRKHSNTRARAGCMNSTINRDYFHEKWEKN